MKISRRKLTLQSHGLLAIAVLLLFWTFGSALAEDNGGGPEPDADGLCEATVTVCEESCDLAKYTLAQRNECGSNCKASYDKCTASAARRGNIKQGLGDVGADPVLQSDDIQLKEKRKKIIKKQ